MLPIQTELQLLHEQILATETRSSLVSVSRALEKIGLFGSYPEGRTGKSHDKEQESTDEHGNRYRITWRGPDLGQKENTLYLAIIKLTLEERTDEDRDDLRARYNIIMEASKNLSLLDAKKIKQLALDNASGKTHENSEDETSTTLKMAPLIACHTSLYRICKTMGLGVGSTNYRKVRLLLNKLEETFIWISQRNAAGEWVSVASKATLILWEETRHDPKESSGAFKGARIQITQPHSFVIINSQYSTIDLDLWLSLLAFGKALYKALLVVHGAWPYTGDLKEFCDNELYLPKNRRIRIIATTAERDLKLLAKAGIISDNYRLYKKGKAQTGEWMIHFEKLETANPPS